MQPETNDKQQPPSCPLTLFGVITEMTVYLGIIALTTAIILSVIGVSPSVNSMSNLAMLGLVFVLADRIGKGLAKWAGNVARGTPPPAADEEKTDDKGDSA